jgi:hypothetical protein
LFFLNLKLLVPLKVLTDTELVQVFTIATTKGSMPEAAAAEESPFPVKPRGVQITAIDIEVPLDCIFQAPHHFSISKSIDGINWSALIEAKPNRKRQWYRILNASVTCIASLKRSCLVEVIVGLKHKELGTAEHQTHTFLTDGTNPLNMEFEVPDILVSFFNN